MDKTMKVHTEWHDIRIRHIRVRARTCFNTSGDLIDAFATPLDRQILRNNRNNKISKQKMMLLIYTAANNSRILEINISQLLRYTEDVYKDNTSHLFIPVRQPFVSLKRTTNLRDFLICSQFNGTIPACYLVPDEYLKCCSC